MSGLIAEMAAKALKLNIPLSVQLDLTYRCNERCVHCYLDHDDHGEMTTAEIKDLLDQMADAGVFYLTISGGEIMMRRDFFEILEHARARTFCIKLKTNGVLIRKKEARAPSRVGRGIGADQHLFASRRSARRHYQDARLVPAVDRSGAFLAGAGLARHHGQCADGPKRQRLSRREGAGRRTGRASSSSTRRLPP